MARNAETYRGTRRNVARVTLNDRKALDGDSWSTAWQRSRANQHDVKRLYVPPVRPNRSRNHVHPRADS